MNCKMTDIYKERLLQGKEYENFVRKVLKEKMNLSVDVYKNIQDQYNIGESEQGFEIKYDKRYKETNNIYIEVAEKTNKNNLNFIDSGIYRNDNSWILLIGNFDVIYFFGINTLRLLYETDRFKEVNTETSKAFLLYPEDIKKYKLKKIIL
tara:strand:+ start:648 stop:1100 length:453 start_codon:yes stop_codon:yes gene_type:complete